MKCIVALSLVAGLASVGSADPIIIDQRPSDFQNGLISETSPGLEARAADDFTLATGNGADWNITKLCGVLLTLEPEVPSSGLFEIYADAGGLPANGAPLYTFNADAVMNVGSAFGYPALEFSVGNGVNTLFSAPAGTTLWLSAVGTGVNPGQYFATFNYGGPVNGNPGAFQSVPFGAPNWINASSQFGVESDFAMCVEGNQRVPAPGAAALLGLGGLAAARRRRA